MAEKTELALVDGAKLRVWAYNEQVPVPPCACGSVIACASCSRTVCRRRPPSIGTACACPTAWTGSPTRRSRPLSRAAPSRTYDPAAVPRWSGCPGYGYLPGRDAPGHSPGSPYFPGYAGCYPYWTSVANPTQYHLDEARRRRAIADQHRAASKKLRDAEARACQGVPPADRDTSPFARVEDIDRVETLRSTSARDPTSVEGARIVFRALPAMTAEWLQRLVTCHAARDAAIGFRGPDRRHVADRRPQRPRGGPVARGRIRRRLAESGLLHLARDPDEGLQGHRAV